MSHECPRTAHDPPKVDVHKPCHLRLIELIEFTQQRNTGIVDEDVERWKFVYGRRSEVLDLLRSSNVDAADRDSAPVSCDDVFRSRLQSRLVHIGERHVAASSRQGKCEGATDSARRSSYRSSRSFKSKFLHVSPVKQLP